MAGRALGSDADVLRGALGAALVSVGVIHLSLTPEHFQESPALGAGFLAAGILQLLLAIAMFRRPSRVAIVAVGASSTALIVSYGVAVAIGLPFTGPAAGAMDEGLRIGAGEPVTIVAAIAKATELASIVLAMMLLGRWNAREGGQLRSEDRAGRDGLRHRSAGKGPVPEVTVISASGVDSAVQKE